MRRAALTSLLLSAAAAVTLFAAPAIAGVHTACRGWGRPAIAADPRPHALRVFAIQFEQHPQSITTGAEYAREIDCAIATEVVPHLARGRSNLVVFDEDVGLETIAAGRRGAEARAVLRRGAAVCDSGPPCRTLATLAAANQGYARALRFLTRRFPALGDQLGRSFVAATDQFVRVFMGTMALAARRYGIYVVASNTQAPFALTRSAAAVAALSDPGGPRERSVYAPTRGIAYDQTFVWGPRVLHRRDPPPLANLLADNYKVPLTAFEQELGFGSGPATGAAARRNLRPLAIPHTRARLGFATSLPAFAYAPATPARACDDVALSYMRCLNRLGANVVIQADANDGSWAGGDAAGAWQPLSWMGSAYRAVSDPSLSFTYAVNPFMVGNLADTPFDGQSAILQRGLRGPGCHYVGNGIPAAAGDPPALHDYAGDKSQFLALAPWVVSDRGRSSLRAVGAALAAGTGGHHYVQTAVIADLTFPADRSRRDCVQAGR